MIKLIIYAWTMMIMITSAERLFHDWNVVWDDLLVTNSRQQARYSLFLIISLHFVTTDTQVINGAGLMKNLLINVRKQDAEKDEVNGNDRFRDSILDGYLSPQQFEDVARWLTDELLLFWPQWLWIWSNQCHMNTLYTISALAMHLFVRLDVVCKGSWVPSRVWYPVFDCKIQFNQGSFWGIWICHSMKCGIWLADMDSR